MNAGFYFLKPNEISDMLTIKKMFKQLPQKIAKSLSTSPIIFFVSQVLIPTSHLGWCCLSLLLPFSSTFHPYHQQSW